MNQLTQQIAGAYIGAQVSGLYKATAADIMQSNIIGMFRLILTPLSHITDDDAVEVVSAGGWSPQNQGSLLDCRFDMNSNEFIANFENSRYRVVLDAAIIDYLRSRNYDLGYMHIRSLIDAGIAISSLDKTETK